MLCQTNCPPVNCTTISIIIPLYNAEKYIAECLDSLLNQTLQNFEVIVVDDCSTDNSVAIVKSYVPKFNGRLTFIKNKKYSGKKSVSQNMGLKLASGEYVLFLNSDDFILTTALETLYNAAKENDADVVYTSAGYALNQSNDITLLRDAESNRLLKKGFKDEPTLTIDDANKNLQQLFAPESYYDLWTRFVRRDLLVENKIIFPALSAGGEFIWLINVACHAERFLRLPTPLYFCRFNNDNPATSLRGNDSADKLQQKVSEFVEFMEALKKVSIDNSTLQDDPAYCSEALGRYFERHFGGLIESNMAESKSAVRETLYNEFSKETISPEAITSFLQSIKTEKTFPEDNPPVADKKKRIYTPSSCGVSVIISLYNYEKYIGECLESLLAQTLHDFEIIVVDDCSTDNSLEIVKSYVPKFDGRLRFTQTAQNTGGGGEPRNIGLNMAQGEYVFFMDADDAFTKTGLEEMYTLAKEYDADTVYCEKYYMSSGMGQDFIDNVHIATSRIQKPPFVTKPSFETKSLAKRIDKMFNQNYWVTAWLRFVKRSLLFDNDIKFYSLVGSNDVWWTFEVMFYSQKLLRVPNACYIRRIHNESTSFRKRTPSEWVHKWMDRTVRSLKAMDNFMGNLKFFRDNPESRYAILDYMVSIDLKASFDKCKGLTKYEWYKSLLEHFGGYLGEHDILVSCLFAHLQDEHSSIEKTNSLFENKLKALASSPVSVPPISVIIPLYNAEKYLRECLDSLLAQTFQNFELIMVDDCSTDFSCEIVESYMPKFGGGRLKLYHMDANTGSGALPRNKGLTMARGEYIYNMDNDDMLTKTALEELYKLAKEYDADVVYCEKYYRVDTDGSNRRIQVMQSGTLVDKPTLEPEDLKERVQRILDKRYWVVPWSKLIRRDLLIEHKLFLPGLKISDDNIWNQGLLFHAKRYLRVPNVIYLYRFNGKSIMRKHKTPEQELIFWLDPVLRGLKILDDLMKDLEFFKKNPSLRYELLRYFVNVRLDFILEACKKLPRETIFATIRNEFGKYFGEQDALISCLCTCACELNVSVANAKQDVKLNATNEKNLQKRIDDQAAEIKRLRARLNSMSKLLLQPTFAISVIIPLYNAGEYVGECLDSLLIQTFQDFEVIIVDDCSTDNSVEIVESYIEKFNGRLTLTKTETNSGGGGYVPRNIGFKLARGEYVYFMDADDYILGSALETFYTLAQEYDTDVIYTAAHYDSRRLNDVFVTRDGKGKELLKDGVEETEQLLTVDEPDKNLHDLIFEKNFTTPWVHFVRRDFLIQNKITFPEIRKAGDYIWAINIYCCAKRFLRLPKPLYFYKRYNVNSVSQSKNATSFSNWIFSFDDYVKALGELSNRTEILRKNPAYCYEASKRYFEWCLNRTGEARKEMSDKEIYEILYNEFNKEKVSSELMMPFLFSMMDATRKERTDHLKSIGDLQKEITQLKKKA